MAIVTFTFGPLAVTISKYVNRGEVDLLLPFLIVYPFNARDIRIWPFVFIHQVWSAAVSIFTVVGPDCLYYACCAYIHIQFRSLQYDIERIVKPDTNESKTGKSDPFWIEFVHLVNRHRELIRCVNLIEATYSKSTLFNFVTSSFLICLTGFNIMAITNIPLAVPFIIFLFMSLLQIYFFCYYGDMIMRSSMAVSSAVYNCQWWRVDAVMTKNMLLVLTRSQKPCKLTAYGFAEVNLRAFTRILSTAWSYFALLKTIYRA
uniref:Odorant receptor 45 n=1 Tax=Streltzoviella insularis TaxID=1206366 RepID=A0A7D5YVM6_9NEOP|nr:odorant receptor 45 [Streltzoviella insularis]